MKFRKNRIKTENKNKIIYKKLEEYFGKTKDWEPWLVVARSVSGCTRHPGQVQDARYVCVGKTESGTV